MRRPNRATILHLDMDAFFAAVEVLDFPELRGKPVIVGSPPDQRGVVATASYEARAFGVRSAMPSRTAGRLCPQGVFRPPRMERYQEVSRQIMDVVESFTPDYEQLSVDEAFMDVAGVLRRWKSGRAIAVALKERIRTELNISCSVGIASNKFLAKLGGALQKPDGLTEVPLEAEAVAAFLAPLPVDRIWGVGRVLEAKLHGFGIRFIADVQRLGVAGLAPLVGQDLSHRMVDLAFGRDERPVVTNTEAQSISAETTFLEDCRDPDVVRQTLVNLVEEVGGRLRSDGRLARTGHLKLRHSDFTTVTRQRPLHPPSRTDRDLIACATGLLAQLNVKGPVRLVGFGVSGFGQEQEEHGLVQLSMFPEEVSDVRQVALDRAGDLIRSRFGGKALQHASALPGQKISKPNSRENQNSG